MRGRFHHPQGGDPQGAGAETWRPRPLARRAAYANMRSMGLAGSQYGLFLKQLNAGHLGLALTYAASLKLDLADFGCRLRVCGTRPTNGVDAEAAIPPGSVA